MSLSHDAVVLAGVSLGAVTVGMALVTFVAMERTRSNTIAALFLTCGGLDIVTIPPFVDRVSRVHPSVLARLQGLLEAGTIATASLWMLALLGTSQIGDRRERLVRVLVVGGLAAAGVHAVLSVGWPALRLDDYALSLGDRGVFDRGGFWVYVAIFLLIGILYIGGWGLLATAGLDPAEARRTASFSLGSAMVIGATVSPPLIAGILITLWISFGMYGQIQFVTARAERTVFLSRVLSPQVTKLVDRRGLAETLKPHHAEITVVSADLRGFTSYSEGVPSQAVVDLLADYYDAVGAAVARRGATITNYAGDGVLILVGAPIADPNHAATGIALAREIQAAVAPVIDRWQTRVHSLGLGVGVASGPVTVGAITAETRMEYTAIGTPVNLAARLCAAAGSGQVLVDSQAHAYVSGDGLAIHGELAVKGLRDKQVVFAAI